MMGAFKTDAMAFAHRWRRASRATSKNITTCQFSLQHHLLKKMIDTPMHSATGFRTQTQKTTTATIRCCCDQFVRFLAKLGSEEIPIGDHTVYRPKLLTDAPRCFSLQYHRRPVFSTRFVHRYLHLQPNQGHLSLASFDCGNDTEFVFAFPRWCAIHATTGRSTSSSSHQDADPL